MPTEPSPIWSHRDAVWISRAAKLICLILGTGIFWLLLRYALPCLLPFFAAWLISFPIRRGAISLQKHLHLPRRVGACVLLLAVLLPLGSLCVLAAQRLAQEAQQLLLTLGSGERMAGAMQRLFALLERVSKRFPLLRPRLNEGEVTKIWQQIDTTLSDMIRQALTRLSGGITDALGAAVRRLPFTLIALLTFLVTVFYCCTDDGRISSFLHGLIPPSWRPGWQRLRAGMAEVGGRYLRAYSLLFLLTFSQLFLGLTLLRLPYVFLPALLISLLDVLPVLGVGTALIPWGLFALLGGNVAQGSGLLILCAVVLIVRQILEPRIVGGSLGLHPVASLMAVYAGLRLGGVPGMVAAPAVAVLIRTALKKESLGS